MIINQIKNNYKIAVYTRESRDEDGENYETIETQKELLIDFANQRNLGEIAKVYVDDNVSGSGFDRVGLNELKVDIENKQVDLILIKDLSRLGRNNAQTLLFLDYLEERRIRVISSDGRYDSEKDNETVGIDTWYNERYIKDISKKIRANLIHKINRGEYIGSAPYGYRKSEEKRNRLVIDETTALVVKEIYNMYKTGYGYAYISRQLNSKGYASPSSKHGNTNASWGPVAVQRIIANRVYTGDTIQRVSEKVSFKSKKTRRLPENMWVITENTHTPIIDKDTFYEIQKIRKGRRKGQGHHKGEIHVFKGLLQCGKCGKTLFARKRKSRPMGYICSTYAKYGLSQCTSHYINEEKLISVISKSILSAFNKKKWNSEVQRLIENKIFKEKESDNNQNLLKKNLESKIKQQDVLYMDKLEGRISVELFERTNAFLEKSLASLRGMLRKVQNSKNNYGNEVERIFKDYINYLKSGNLTNDMTRILIKNIVVFDQNDKLPEGITKKKQGNGLIQINYYCNFQ